MEAAGKGRGEGEDHVRRTAPSAASDANGHRSTHGSTGAAARLQPELIIRGRLGLDEGRGEGERGAWAWPWLGLMMVMLALTVLYALPLFHLGYR